LERGVRGAAARGPSARTPTLPSPTRGEEFKRNGSGLRGAFGRLDWLAGGIGWL
jgi:hypothetical protein